MFGRKNSAKAFFRIDLASIISFYWSSSLLLLLLLIGTYFQLVLDIFIFEIKFFWKTFWNSYFFFRVPYETFFDGRFYFFDGLFFSLFVDLLRILICFGLLRVFYCTCGLFSGWHRLTRCRWNCVILYFIK